MTYDPFKDEPKTVEEYIEYAKCWLSGDSGWSEENIEEIMREFALAVRRESRTYASTSFSTSYVPYFGTTQYDET
jgi:hypothetical protein